MLRWRQLETESTSVMAHDLNSQHHLSNSQFTGTQLMPGRTFRIVNLSLRHGTWRKVLHSSYGFRISYQKLGSKRACSILSKFLVTDKSGTRMHHRLAKLLVRDSGTSNLDREFGSSAVGLLSSKLLAKKCFTMQTVPVQGSTLPQWNSMIIMLQQLLNCMRSAL